MVSDVQNLTEILLKKNPETKYFVDFSFLNINVSILLFFPPVLLFRNNYM